MEVRGASIVPPYVRRFVEDFSLLDPYESNRKMALMHGDILPYKHGRIAKDWFNYL